MSVPCDLHRGAPLLPDACILGREGGRGRPTAFYSRTPLCYAPRMAAPTLTLDEIAALPKGARLMGLDLGTKTIGLSLTDVERRIASPAGNDPSRQVQAGC